MTMSASILVSSVLIGRSEWISVDTVQLGSIFLVNEWRGGMLPKLVSGRWVQINGRDEIFVAEAIKEDGGAVGLVAKSDSTIRIQDVPCLQLLLVEGGDVD